ncbi:FadR family transcriptional regulator (plasmid) [Qingshengfaniella alkalisoli]|uniref:FadR family transcriptional regulator n=1 Tax=Qingshengfaniella alkalisoli TaxID=2599296 RepID=A0A5B8IAV5_9RHOB|nr:FadR family transcriptional regulator [Qingshengfaniella alkalisoli]
MRPDGKDRSNRDWSLADQVYEEVLRRIVEGEFPENSKLPSENSLSEQLGVSRPVLRQALSQLRDDGIVLSRQGSGSYVHKRPAKAMLSFAPVGSIADIQRTFEFRITIESEAAALAAKRWNEQSLGRIEQALKALDGCIETGALGADADEEFHLAIASATDNHYFMSTRASMKPQILMGMNLARSLSLTVSSDRLKLVQSEHYEILDAIRRRDSDAAHKAMRRHVENARTRIFDGTPASH